MDRDIDKPEREKVEVIIYLKTCKIKGALYLPPESRLSDFINSPVRQFIPVTDAEIESTGSENWDYKVKFLNLNKNEIVTIFLKSAFIEGHRGGGK